MLLFRGSWGGWETMHNANSKVVEFDHFRQQAGFNSFVLNPKTWIERTGAIGLVSKSVKFGIVGGNTLTVFSILVFLY